MASGTTTSGGGLTDRYAIALYAQADETQQLDQVVSEMDSLGQLIDQSADFRRLLESPLIDVNQARTAAQAVLATGLPLRRDMAAAMTGEDFAWYLQQRPGAFVWIGNGSSTGGRELHNANYDFNDAILPAAASYLASVAKRALG